MRIKRLAVSAATVVTVVAGLGLATASPAAAKAGVWRAYGNDNPIDGSNSIWVCAATRTITTDVLAQVCAIRASPRPPYDATDAVQVAVIVRNNRSSLYSARADGDLSNYRTNQFIERWSCPSSGVASKTWSVCFGETISNSPNDKVVARGGVNGKDLGVSQQV